MSGRQSFDFGANWESFSRSALGAPRLEQAKHALADLVGAERLRGAAFLDVGSGSGLMSLAAHALGAVPVVGIDVDPLCVEVANRNRDRLLPGAPVRFERVSALDASALAALGHHDVVYAWGSLHHSGEMWRAVRNVSSCVRPGGLLVLGLYNRHFSSPAWKLVKWSYVRLPRPVNQLLPLLLAAPIALAKLLVTRRSPFAKARGMDFWHDVVDWVGGYPYEYASPREVESRLQALGFGLRRLLKAEVPTGCNELVFERLAEPKA